MAKVDRNLDAATTEKKMGKQKDKKKGKNKKANEQPKRSRTKETFAELKKVSWPTFGKTMKQTGMVISVVFIFMLVTLGFDSLLSWLLKLISNI